MQVTIGIRDAARELSLDIESTGEEIYSLVAAAREAGKPLKIADKDGKVAIVPIDALAYIEVAASENRRVGFGL